MIPLSTFIITCSPFVGFILLLLLDNKINQDYLTKSLSKKKKKNEIKLRDDNYPFTKGDEINY
jgi:hypothetical protein